MDKPDRKRAGTAKRSITPEDPFLWFERWYRSAQASRNEEPHTMVLSTVSPQGQPAARVVLMRGYDREGFRFFTNYDSRKGIHIRDNSAVALTFWWPEIRRQVRIEGVAERLSAAESDAYYQSRPRGHRVGAWASQQSRELISRDALKAAYRQFTGKFRGEVIPRPAYWGGFRVIPRLFEFWQEERNRLHDRFEFKKTAGGRWLARRLSP